MGWQPAILLIVFNLPTCILFCDVIMSANSVCEDWYNTHTSRSKTHESYVCGIEYMTVIWSTKRRLSVFLVNNMKETICKTEINFIFTKNKLKIPWNEIYLLAIVCIILAINKFAKIIHICIAKVINNNVMAVIW